MLQRWGRVEEIFIISLARGCRPEVAFFVFLAHHEISSGLAHLLPLLFATLGLPHLFVLSMITRSEMELVCLLRLSSYFCRASWIRSELNSGYIIQLYFFSCVFFCRQATLTDPAKLIHHVTYPHYSMLYVPGAYLIVWSYMYLWFSLRLFSHMHIIKVMKVRGMYLLFSWVMLFENRWS
jgi:hypothetical protein